MLVGGVITVARELLVVTGLLPVADVTVDVTEVITDDVDAGSAPNNII